MASDLQAVNVGGTIVTWSARSTARVVGVILLLLGIAGVAAILDCAMSGIGQDQCYDNRRALGARGGMAIFGGLFLLSWAWVEDRRDRDRQRDAEPF